MIEQEIISIAKASENLNVSQATVRNWIKTGLLTDSITYKIITDLQSSIKLGDIQRLNKRANKLNSQKSFIPVEYLSNSEASYDIEKVIDLSKNYFNSKSETILNFTFAFLLEKNEIIISSNNVDDIIFKRHVIKKIFNSYESIKNIDFKFIKNAKKYFKRLCNSGNIDVLGILYQSILNEGEKSKGGSYYTPISIIDSMISRLGNIKNFLDPCCGTGSFLLSVAKEKKLSIDNIYGADIDKNAVFIAKINLLTMFPTYNKEPKIFCVDSLNELATGDAFCNTNFLISNIDAIATNPPWGAVKNESPSKKYEQLLRSKEIFSMFIAKSIELVKNNSECAFLLPESVLNIKTHKSIRKMIVNKTEIISIQEYGRAFKEVFSPVISIHFKKQSPNKKHKIKIKTQNKTYLIPQDRFNNSDDYIFNIKVSPTDYKIIEKIYSKQFYTLKNHSKWALGIVTGNNKAFLKPVRDNDTEPIYKGSDISYFRLNDPKNFIKYNRNIFQQVAKDEYYRAPEKLIYKFISNKLVFAYDNKQSLTLNSANILIPSIPKYNVLTTLALLNSKVFQYLFKIKFSTHKVLRGDLEQLPFPVLRNEEKELLTRLTEEEIKSGNKKEDIDDVVNKIFRLNSEEIKIITDTIEGVTN